MQPLKDVICIYRIFDKSSRRKIMFAALYKPSCFYLADLYFCLGMSGIIIAAWMQTGLTWLIALVLPFSILFIYRFDPAIRNAYPFLTDEPELEKGYRNNFRYIRFCLFSDELKERGFSAEKVRSLEPFFRMESELAEAHPSALTRPATSLLIILLIGLISATGGIAEFWIKGYWSVVIPVLIWIIVMTSWTLEILHPSAYHKKELEIFLEWYCYKESSREDAEL